MDIKFQKISRIIGETFNCAAGISAFESPARPWRKTKAKKIDFAKMLTKMHARRGDK